MQFTVCNYKPLQRVSHEVIAQLTRDHPDKELVDFVASGFRDGFKLGMTSTPAPRGLCKNSQKVRQNPEIAQQLVDEEVKKGHILGPFDMQPLPEMWFSPLNIVPKAGNPGKWRLIHDLAYPYDGKKSINDCIPSCNLRVNYQHIDDIIDIALAIGTCATGARVDVSHAFHNLGMHVTCLKFLGFTLNGKFYINSSLPFSAASSCLIFEKVATLVQWIVTNETKRTEISHYLDDFPLLGCSWSDTKIFITQFTHILQKIGLPIAQDKTIGPTDCLKYLGMLLDFKHQVLAIPEKKRLKCIELITNMITAYRNRKPVQIKLIQKLAGHLNFICQAIPVGLTFMCGLYSLIAPTHGEKVKTGHHRRLNKDMHDDLEMFLSFLGELQPSFCRTIPFLVRRDLQDDQIMLFADASGSNRLGIGCVYQSEWAQGLWRDTTVFRDNPSPNIAVLELLAITIAFEIWAPQLSGSCITLRSDNQATVYWLNRKRTDIPAAMNLLMHLTKTCLLFQIYIKAVYINTKKNRQSDLISRDKVPQLLREFPHMNPCPRLLPGTLWPPMWQPGSLTPTQKQASKQHSNKQN